jgi:hypothetical protein
MQDLILPRIPLPVRHQINHGYENLCNISELYCNDDTRSNYK